MQDRLIVLDFDGTLTDVEQDGERYTTNYLADLADLTGCNSEQIQTLYERFNTIVHDNANDYGWKYDGYIVAPSLSDPYLRILPVAEMIFDECQVFLDSTDRKRLLDRILYKHNYRRTNTVFHKGTLEFLNSMKDESLYIVTNSDTTTVCDKIKSLEKNEGDFLFLCERTRGNAKKYVVDQTFDDVPETLSLEGLSRPVYLRRPFYYNVLNTLLKKENKTWDQLLVVGDIFELDLSLPLSQGAEVMLMKNERTPDYECNFLAKHSRGRLVHSVTELSTILNA